MRTQKKRRAQIGSGILRAVALGMLLAGFSAAAAAQDAPQRISVASTVQDTQIVHRVTPAYPPLARAAGVDGDVRLQVYIGTDGSVTKVEKVSGHALLVRAAIDAVSQWKYKPTSINGKAVEVVTTVDILFKR